MSWRSAVRDDRRVACLWAFCAGFVVLLRPLWIAAAGFLPPCLWRAATGWPCPGCGTTRALVHLLHGNPSAAFASNPLAASAAVAFVAGGLVAPVWLACGGPRPHVAARYRRAVTAAVVAAVVANWSWLAVSGR